MKLKQQIIIISEEFLSTSFSGKEKWQKGKISETQIHRRKIIINLVEQYKEGTPVIEMQQSLVHGKLSYGLFMFADTSVDLLILSVFLV
jgi:hypothetical protein